MGIKLLESSSESETYYYNYCCMERKTNTPTMFNDSLFVFSPIKIGKYRP